MKLIFFIGPQKTGTTYIYKYLYNNHPEIFVKGPKEQFILNEQNGYSVISRLIHRHLDKSFLCFVEPSYFLSDIARVNISRLKEFYEVEAIYTARDPLRRSESHFLHHKSKGRCSSIEKCVHLFPEIINGSLYYEVERHWSDHGIDLKRLEMKDVLSDPHYHLSKLINGLKLDPRFDVSEIINMRQSPRNRFMAGISVGVLDLLRKTWLRGLTHGTFKEYIKKNIMYGGPLLELSDAESNTLKELLARGFIFPQGR